MASGKPVRIILENACSRIIPQQDFSTRCARELFQDNEGRQDHSMRFRDLKENYAQQRHFVNH
jgi:hypothetical protein